MTELDSLDGQALLVLLGSASALAGGASIALADAEGRIVGGTPVVGGLSLSVRLEDEVIGQVVYDSAVPEGVAELVRAAVEMVVHDARQHASRARAAHELEIGRDIQRSLLPRRFPDVPGWRFAADYEPAREVGGDLYDVFRLRGANEDVGLLIADVTGKGVPAALLMADTKALLHAAADNADDPADALARVNRILAVERRSSLFVTALLATVDADSGKVRLASAGHEPLLVIRTDGRVEEVQASGALLGAFVDVSYELEDVQVDPGETLVFYTDGITDTRDPSRAFYGEPRLHALLADLAGAAADDVRRAVVDDVRAFRGEADAFDDLTILVAQRES